MRRMVLLWVFVLASIVPLHASDEAVKFVFDSFNFGFSSSDAMCKIWQAAFLLPYSGDIAKNNDFCRERGAESISLAPTCLVELETQEDSVTLIQLEGLIPRVHEFFQNLQAKMGEEDFYSKARNTPGGVPLKYCLVDVKGYLCPFSPYGVHVEESVSPEMIEWVQSRRAYPVYASILVCNFALKGLATLLANFSSLNDFEKFRLVEVLAEWKAIKDYYYAQFVGRHGSAEIDLVDKNINQYLKSLIEELEDSMRKRLAAAGDRRK